MNPRLTFQRSLLAVMVVFAVTPKMSAEDGLQKQSRVNYDRTLEHGGDKIHVTITEVPFRTHGNHQAAV